MQYWLMKSEPTTYSIEDLRSQPKQTDHWDGIRNYQARNFMRDDMRVDDLAFFYHSSCEQPGIVGVIKVVKEAYPDHTAWDPQSHYYDHKSTTNNPRWYMVDVKLVHQFSNPISLQTLRQQPQLSEMQLLKKGNRLSIMPIRSEEWKAIMHLANETF